MRVIRSIEDSGPRVPGVVTVGTYDGVHRGHRTILQYLIDRHRATGYSPTMATFDPHPQSVVKREGLRPIRILTTVDEKLQILESLGIERVFIINFTEEFRRTSAEDFVKNILVECLNVKELVIGWDHAFGKDRQGSFDTLKNLGGLYGFTVDRIPPVYEDGQVISSTRIREMVLDGDMEAARRILEYPYMVTGIVVAGDGRGRRLGFPTANLNIGHPRKLLPKDGVYAARAHFDGQDFPAMVNIGFRPTFTGADRTVEAHILGFSGTLNGAQIRLHFYRRLRDEKRFASVDALRTQLELDKNSVVSFFSKS